MSEIEKKEIEEPLAELNGTNDVDDTAEVANGDEKTVNAKKNKKKNKKKKAVK